MGPIEEVIELPTQMTAFIENGKEILVPLTRSCSIRRHPRQNHTYESPGRASGTLSMKEGPSVGRPFLLIWYSGLI